MKICCLVFVGLLGMAAGQLFSPGSGASMTTDPLAGLGVSMNGLDPTGMGMGMGMGSGMGSGMGMGMGSGQQQGVTDPMMKMLIMQLAMSDVTAMSGPVMSMLMQNPSIMSSPMGAIMISSMLGSDLNKIAAPLAMMNGGTPGGMMRWLPLLSGDLNAMTMMMTMGGIGGMGMGGMGMGGMGGMGGMMPFMAASGM